jgi:drug/metabolite transporter (DMT)-like permease
VALPTSTLVGTLLLDSASAFTVAEAFIMGERFDVIITVPMIQELVGASFAVQGGGATLNSAFILGSATTFTIGS